MTGIDEKRIEEIIKSFSEPAVEKAASDEVDPAEVLKELEKVANSVESDVTEGAGETETEEEEEDLAIQGELDVTSDDLSKQKLKEILLKGLKEDNPSPQFQALKDALLNGGREKEVLAFVQGIRQLVQDGLELNSEGGQGDE